MFIFPVTTFVFLILAIYRRHASRLNLPKAFLIAAVVWILLFLGMQMMLKDVHIFKIPYFSVSWVFTTWVTILLCTFLSADKMASLETLNLKKKIFVFFANAKAGDIMILMLFMIVFLLIVLISYSSSIGIL